MNRQGFLLGFFSTGAQVLLLRELVSSLNGSELFIGTALFGWLIAVAAGAYLGGRASAFLDGGLLLLLFAAMMLLTAAAMWSRKRSRRTGQYLRGWRSDWWAVA